MLGCDLVSGMFSDYPMGILKLDIAFPSHAKLGKGTSLLVLPHCMIISTGGGYRFNTTKAILNIDKS